MGSDPQYSPRIGPLASDQSPNEGEAAVMQQGVFNSTRYRDLYEYDIKCAEELGDQRALSGYRKAHSGGSFSSTSNWTGGWPFIGGWAASKGTVGVTWLSGSVYWSASAIRQSSNFSETPFGHYWTRNLDTGNTKLVVGNGYLYAIAPLVAVWRENTTIDRVFYSESRDFPTRWTDVGSSRRLTQRYSSNEFSTTTTTPMYGCTSMSGWMTCGGVALIHTGKRVSVAWDNAITRSHTAWSQQNRATDNDSRRLWIATGNVSDSRLPIANGLPAPAGVATLRSSVSPGLACQTGAAGGYNCIAAYVDDSNGLPDVRVQRFSATSGATHFGLNTEGVARVVLGNVRTYSDIAAWFHNGKFYVAIRPARVNQNLEVYSSSNGATWQFEGTFEHTAVGPSAVSYWTGNNQLIWFD